MNIQLDDIRDDITRMVTIALEEDIGSGDITAELIPVDKVDTATVITREDCVVCGTAWFDEVFKQLGDIAQIDWHVKDGEEVSANSTLVTLKGNTRKLLTGERTALNFLQLLSGTATKSREYAKLVEGTNITVLDTRKTIPGLRTAQKYAVAAGGCSNHRIGLYDAFLIKENHIAAAGSITKAVATARSLFPDRPLIVEVENTSELDEALRCDVTRIMLDNFDLKTLDKTFSDHPTANAIEVSGNMSADRLKNANLKIPVSVSIGDLTKNLTSIDLSMGIRNLTSYNS